MLRGSSFGPWTNRLQFPYCLNINLTNACRFGTQPPLWTYQDVMMVSVLAPLSNLSRVTARADLDLRWLSRTWQVIQPHSSTSSYTSTYMVSICWELIQLCYYKNSQWLACHTPLHVHRRRWLCPVLTPWMQAPSATKLSRHGRTYW